MKNAFLGLILLFSTPVFAGSGLGGEWAHSRNSFISDLSIVKFDGTYIVRGSVRYSNTGWFQFKGTTVFNGNSYYVGNAKMAVTYGRMTCYYRVQLMLILDGDQLLVQANVPDHLNEMDNNQCPANSSSGFEIVGDRPFTRK